MDYRIGQKPPKNVQAMHALMMENDEVNHRLLRAILGVFPSVEVCAKAFDVDYVRLVNLINLQCSPLRVQGNPSNDDYSWRKICETVAHNLGYSVGDLFPPELYPLPTGADESVPIPRVISVGRLMSRIALDPRADVVTSVDRHILVAAVRTMLRRLSFRSREILSLRFGLQDGHCYTLDEVSTLFRISHERTRQIEVGALVTLGKCCRVPEQHAAILHWYWIRSSTPLGPEPDESPLSL